MMGPRLPVFRATHCEVTLLYYIYYGQCLVDGGGMTWTFPPLAFGNVSTRELTCGLSADHMIAPQISINGTVVVHGVHSTHHMQ